MAGAERPAPRPVVRLFVAVWPPQAVVEAVRAALATIPPGPGPAGRRGGRAGGSGAGLSWVPPGQWHVTLRFFGDAPLDEVALAFRSVAAPGGAQVEAEVGPVTARFGRRVLHVPVGGLEDLAAATVAATRGVGRPPDGRPFAGHLTLARARERGGTDLSGWCGIAVGGRFRVGELTLVASRVEQDATRYEVVDRLVLPGAGEGPCPNTRSQLH